jgi:hypothetical protein
MMHFHPDLIVTVHEDRMDSRRVRSRSPRKGEDVRWIRTGRPSHGARRRSD